ncbi:protein argonaute 2-like [Tripterygium wilfordii]|uniref:Protein argonaute 2-like n=1 Tax=Tripterygium wilfordii TaxID=458696 RepID=A0A7J7C3K3_TRIWF|nr:protein argonaute 2-like [Tripterygium wilfordii]
MSRQEVNGEVIGPDKELVEHDTCYDSRYNGPCGGDISKNFGIEVDMNMTTVTGRVIKPPELKLCTQSGKFMKVLWDEHNITRDELQELCYSMCFTGAQSTKPVSVVPPMWYADRVAHLYHDAIE